jgi:arsenate reductase
MKNTVFYLQTCDTCKRIIKELGLNEGFELREIKSNTITPDELDAMHELVGSYEALFSKRSRQYAARDLKNKTLSENDYRSLILEEYTFLKRPVVFYNNQIFVGNAKKNLEALKEAMA